MKKLERKDIYNKYEKHCAYCGIMLEYDEMQVDHIVPKQLGGKDEMTNYNPACRSCNASKSTYSVAEFRKRLVEDVARLRRDSAKFRILERMQLVTANIEYPLIFYSERGRDPR